jgi:phage terminase large subunit-like protein
MSSAPGAHGATVPRIWTPPLRDLAPATSYGYDLIDFARDVLGEPFDPWQEWAAIHLGELLPDGRPRFRTVLVMAARQNGKSLLGSALVAYWMAVEQVPLVLGTSTDRKYAKRSWTAMCERYRRNPYLAQLVNARSVRLTLGEESLKTVDGSEYIFAANNGNAARSTTLHRWLCDELREHTDWACWSSASNAMNAVPGAQTVVLSNQCDDTGIVLDSLRTSALEYIETSVGDPRLGLLEWSAPDGCDPADLDGLAMANPNLGRRVDPDALMGAALRAKAAGGQELADFRTEVLCQRVRLLDPAIDPDAWAQCGTDAPLDLADHRDRVALAFDVSLDGRHATLCAAAMVDGRVHLEVVRAWDSTEALRRELPAIVEQVRPRTLGWLPAGPAAAVAADLADRNARGWPPRRVKIDEIKGEVTAVAMGFEEQTRSGQLVHPRDPLLDKHVENAQRLRRGDAWTFQRRGAGPVDALYAAAAAVHCARTLPPAPPTLFVA